MNKKLWFDFETRNLADDIDEFLDYYSDDPNIALVTVNARQLVMAIRQAPTRK